MLTVEQIVAAQKANADTAFGLTSKAFEGLEKLVALNLQVAKSALADTSSQAQAVLNVKDAQELLALQAGLAKPAADKAAAYSREVYAVATATGAEFTKAFEAQAAEAQAKVMSLVDNVTKNAPAGSETAVAVLKNAVNAANNAAQSVQQAVKQATDMAEANFINLAANATKAVATTTAKKR